VTKAEFLTFRSSAPIEKFLGVKIDGVALGWECSVKSGSTIVILEPRYITGLSDGAHEIEIVSTDGSAKANFNVQLSCRNHIDVDYDLYYSENKDGLCDFCGIVWCVSSGLHYDGNNDHRCDWCCCSDPIWHYDENDDMRCDECGFLDCQGIYCEDKNKDCVCDWCVSCFHESENSEGYCNNCGTRMSCGNGKNCYDEEIRCVCTSCGRDMHEDFIGTGDGNGDSYCDRCGREIGHLYHYDSN
jgi:hypothetical protein